MIRYAVMDKSTGRQVYDFDGDGSELSSFPISDFEYVEIPASAQVSHVPEPTYGGRRVLTRSEFIILIGLDIYKELLLLSDSSIDVRVWMEFVKVREEVNLDSELARQGLSFVEQALVQQGVVEPGWAEGVLRG